MDITPEEVIELIDMHGRTMAADCMCPDCAEPIKSILIERLARIRQLVDLLPDHAEEPVTPINRKSMQ